MGIRRGTRRGFKMVASRLEASGVRALDRLVSRLAGVPVRTEPRALFKKAVQLADSALARVEHAEVDFGPEDSRAVLAPDSTAAPAQVSQLTQERVLSAEQLREALQSDEDVLEEPDDILVLVVQDADSLFATWKTKNEGAKTLELIEAESGKVHSVTEVSGREGRHSFKNPGKDLTVAARLSGQSVLIASNRARTAPSQSNRVGREIFLTTETSAQVYSSGRDQLNSGSLTGTRVHDLVATSRMATEASTQDQNGRSAPQLGGSVRPPSTSYFLY